MAYKRFQNTVAESKLLLPFSIAVAAAALYLSGIVDGGWWVQLMCLVVSTALLVELNNTNQLLRVVSQCTPAVFLLLVSVAIGIFPELEAGIMQLCMIALYYMLFHCRQRKESPGWTFYGFFCLGLSSMVFPQVLYYVPLFWVLMATCLRAMTAKTFWASLLGLITPYWLGGPVIIYLRGTSVIPEHFSHLWTFAPLGDYSMLGEQEWLTAGWVILLALIGIVHYSRLGYQDKTRTRLLHEIFITVDIVSILFLTLQPQYYAILLSIIIVNTSPLIAHFLTLTHTWLTNIAFHLIIVITLALIAYNVWMPSSSFLHNMAIQACSYLPL